MYEMKSRIRYSEVGPDRRLTLISMIEYLQDCATFHSEDLGLGLDFLEKNDMGWVLAGWQIVIERYPELCEDITVSTWPYQFRGYFAYRNLMITGSGGEVIAKADSIWILVDTTKGRPRKPVEEQVEKYVLEPRLDMDYAPRKIRLAPETEECDPVEVHRHMIDTNGHMNNGQYVLIARELLPADFEVRQLRTEYKTEAVLGSVIYPKKGYTEDGACVIRLDDENGKSYAIVEFR